MGGPEPGSQITRQDESIINTNSYSIVSKRSVEKLYYPGESFFAPFAPRVERRAPLINRGYWLRMRAVEAVVRHFLADTSRSKTETKQKLVVNLGCGYDPLPLQMLHRYPEGDGVRQAKFVDVDYPPLVRRKVDVLLKEGSLTGLVEDVQTETERNESVLLNSKNYAVVGCDLRHLDQLKDVLRGLAETATCEILFVAEVSITYMDVVDSDALIQWASGFSHARFCLLEQCLPDGPDHPFAQRMLYHFGKHGTPIKAVGAYQTTEDQRARFLQRGWALADIRNLWALWSDDTFIAADERRILDRVEPFDEWEELALFACHYFLLYAQAGEVGAIPTFLADPSEVSNRLPASDARLELVCDPQLATSPVEDLTLSVRRFGAGFIHSDGVILYQGGVNSNGVRSASYDIYTNDPASQHPDDEALWEPVVGHTITHLADGSLLKVGGRYSPSQPCGSCFHRPAGTVHPSAWTPRQDISPARYRHCTAAISILRPHTNTALHGTLCFGGKSNSIDILEDWKLWDQESGWREVLVHGTSQPAPTFGATMIPVDEAKAHSSAEGILLGGIGVNGRVIDRCWHWHFQLDDSCPRISFEDITPTLVKLDPTKTCARFGAKAVALDQQILIIGGVTSHRLLKRDEEFLQLQLNPLQLSALDVIPKSGERPLLTGFDAIASTRNAALPGEAVVIGGGAVCYAFGRFHNRGCWTLRKEGYGNPAWRYVDTFPMEVPTKIPGRGPTAAGTRRAKRSKPVQEPGLGSINQMVN